MERDPGCLLVTGGAGFIGTNFVRYLFEEVRYEGRVVILDKLTYAGNLDNLSGLETGPGRCEFVRGDICDAVLVEDCMRRYQVEAVIHFAAESHVDRSIVGPQEFIVTNVLGTGVLLDAARRVWGERDGVVFHHISTDEVFGSLGAKGRFAESSCYHPRSPYAATKAAADHLVRAYHHTYGLPVLVSNSSNNYGPYQFPEKLIPLMICNMLEGRPLPIYGAGANVRDWLYVRDHCEAIWLILRRAKAGSTYCVGGQCERSNLEIVQMLCDKVAAAQGRDSGEYRRLITFVADRPGHDMRYAIDPSVLHRDLGWQAPTSLEKGLELTVEWYLSHPEWVSRVRSGEYQRWIEINYGSRL